MGVGSWCRVVSAVAGILGALTCLSSDAPTLPTNPAATSARVARALPALAMPFMRNEGQVSPRVAYYATTVAGTVFVTHDGAIVHRLNAPRPAPDDGYRAVRLAGASRPSAAGEMLTETLVGATPVVAGGARSTAKVSILRGRDRAQGFPHVATHDTVELGEAWPGVTLSLRARASSVEKIFTVAPGASTAAIRIAAGGASGMHVADDGRLVVAMSAGEIAFSAPVAWQDGPRGRVAVDVAYALDGTSYGFRLGAYDATLPLTIDPWLQSTFVGGSGADQVHTMLLHPLNGDVYVGGASTSTDLPQAAGGADTTPVADAFNAFVVRISPSLLTIVQATYLGGDANTSSDVAALAVDPATGDVYAAGFTDDATNWPGPVTGTTVSATEAFITRLPASLTSATMTRFLGGSGSESVVAMAFHPVSGDLYAAGGTTSADFAGVTGGADTTFAGGSEAFVARMPPSLATLTQATYLGGDGGDGASGLAISPTTGEIYVGGQTDENSAATFPGISGGADTTAVGLGGGGIRGEGFVSRLSADLATVNQSTFLGGDATREGVSMLAFHPLNGDLYATGQTTDGANFPGLAGGADTSAAAGVLTLFVTRLAPSLTTIVQSTYFGGDLGEGSGFATMAIHPGSGDVYLAGWTRSTAASIPGLAGGLQTQRSGVTDSLVVRLAPALTSIVQSTLLGGSDAEFGWSIAVVPGSGDLVVAGITDSADFPRVAGGGDTTFADVAEFTGGEGFVVRITSDLRPAATPVPVDSAPWIAFAMLVLAAFGAAALLSRGRRG